MEKKKRNRIIAIVLILIVAAMMIYKYFENKNKPRGEAVEFDKVAKRTILETVSASGRIFPEKEVKISSDVSGEIVELYVMEGDSVIAGQLLAKIDPDTYISAVERGKAAVNTSKANMAQSKSQMENAKAQKEQIIAQLKNAETIHKRNADLLKDGVVSQAEFDQSLSNLEGLQANLRASESSIKAAEEAVNASNYNILSNEATLKELKTSLSRTVIKAPVNGIVSSLSVEQGERVVGTIQMTGTEMMRIANLNTMEVQVDVSENDIISVSMGDSVNIEVDAYLDKTFRGKVTEIANSASNANTITGSLNTDQVTNFIVKIRVDPISYKDQINQNNKYPLRPGMSASVDIFTNKKQDVLSIPIQAVTTKQDTTIEDSEQFDEIVWVHSADTVVLAKVTTGIQDDEYIEIIAGLDLDTEIVKGPYGAVSKRLEDGDRVREREEKEDKEGKD